MAIRLVVNDDTDCPEPAGTAQFLQRRWHCRPATRGLATGLVVPLQHDGQTREALETLGLTPGKPLNPAKPPSLADPDSVGLQSDTLWPTPHSGYARARVADRRDPARSPAAGYRAFDGGDNDE